MEELPRFSFRGQLRYRKPFSLDMLQAELRKSEINQIQFPLVYMVASQFGEVSALPYVLRPFRFPILVALRIGGGIVLFHVHMWRCVLVLFHVHIWRWYGLFHVRMDMVPVRLSFPCCPDTSMASFCTQMHSHVYVSSTANDPSFFTIACLLHLHELDCSSTREEEEEA